MGFPFSSRAPVRCKSRINHYKMRKIKEIILIKSMLVELHKATTPLETDTQTVTRFSTTSMKQACSLQYLKNNSSCSIPLWPDWSTEFNTSRYSANGKVTNVRLIPMDKCSGSSRILFQNGIQTYQHSYPYFKREGTNR